MADEVIISNVGGEGGVASEATLAALVRAVEKMGAAKGMAPGSTAAKVQALHNKAVAEGTTAEAKNTVETKKNTENVSKAAQAAENFGRKLGGLAAQGIGQAVAALGGMAKSLIAGEDSIEAYASQIPVFGGILGALAGYADKSVDAFREMSSVGASFNNDILAMRRAAAENNLSLDEFKNIVTQNSAALSALGGTVTGGVQRFTAINRTLKETGDFESLKAMGFSITEINEGLADYTSLQSRLGRLQGKSNKELAAGSAAYLKELDQLSKLTGKSRKELAADMEKNAADAGFRALQNQFKEGTKEFENFRKNMALIDTLPSDIATGLKDLADGIPQTAEGIALLNAAGPQLADAMKKVGEGADPSVLLNALKQAGGDMEKFAGMDARQRKIFIDSIRQSDPTLAGILDGATKMLELGNKDLAAAEKEQAKRDEVTKRLTTFQDAIREMSEAIQVAFVDSGLIELFAAGVGMFAKMITGAADSIKAFTANFKEDPIGAIVNLVKDGIVGLFSNTTVIAALVGGITALFLGKAALGAMNKAMTGWAERSISKLVGGGAAPSLAQAAPDVAPGGKMGAAKPSSAGKGFGQALGNIGKGLGQGIGGILKGLAGGLAAFANPAILVGAGILGGAIVAIGAGIAGATWLMGKALPTFAEGLKSFADIDGDNLLQVAKGIAGVGAALAAMGAGAAIGAVGNVIANVLEALPGKGPMDRLVEFSNLNIDAKKVEANANAATAFASAMAALGKGGAVGELGNVAANLASGIVSFFGGDPPWAKMVEFGNFTINLDNIENNSKATVKYAEAMKALSGVPAPGILGTLTQGIASFFSVSVPWAKMVEFGNFSVNLANIENNSKATVKYAEAMKALSGVAAPGLLSTLTQGVASFFGVSVPWEKLVSFSNLQLGGNVAVNARAMKLFGDAMRDLPEIKGERTGGLMGAIANFFGGEVEMPWDKLKAFGEMQINADAVTKNATALSSFGNALRNFQGGGDAKIGIDANVIDSLQRLAAVNNRGGLDKTAAGFAAIGASGSSGVTEIFSALNALDSTKVSSYNTALKSLVDTLSKLNEQLAKDNNSSWFGGGDKANAGDVLKNISLNTSAGAGNSEQLKNIMTQIYEVLVQMKDIDDKIEKNTKRGSGSDISTRDVSSF